ncbi:MAG: hypothetical protein EOP51_17175 [Sphingobacteriales bacterium]|nr:MAG: hypothetical protein EOP51_17175 [Sphingobacteriales bacterium]
MIKDTAQLGNGITVDINITPVKSNNDISLYDLYLIFTFRRGGAQPIRPVTISTGKSVEVEQWERSTGKRKGRGIEVTTFNNSLQSLINNTRAELESQKELTGNAVTCLIIRDFLRRGGLRNVTGKAPRGAKAAIQKAENANSIDAVLAAHLSSGAKKVAERQRIYGRAIQVLHEFYGNKTPNITEIGKAELARFRAWYLDTYDHAEETQITYLSMIRAVFRYAAEDTVGIIPFAPIPKMFVPVKQNDTERYILSEADRAAFMWLADEKLSHTEQVAKYVACLQITTGMGYGDVRTLRAEHLHHAKDRGEWYVKRPRSKTKINFTVFLTEVAEHSQNRLRELVPGTGDNMFNLPTIDYMNRMYEDIAKHAGISKFTTYDLRHTFAVDYMDNDGTLEDLAKILGHKGTKTTAIYGRISEERQSRKMQQLQQRSAMHRLPKNLKTNTHAKSEDTDPNTGTNTYTRNHTDTNAGSTSNTATYPDPNTDTDNNTGNHMGDDQRSNADYPANESQRGKVIRLAPPATGEHESRKKPVSAS